MLKHEKPHQCEKCDSDRVAVILYGLPIFTEELERDIDAGRVVLGGCCRTPDSPEWFCMACQHKWRGASKAEFALGNSINAGMVNAKITDNKTGLPKPFFGSSGKSYGEMG